MKYSEKLNRKIDKMLAENEAEQQSLRAKIERAEADKKAGQLDQAAAADDNDDAAYHAAKEKIRFAEDTIEMCSNKLDTLDKSMCSESDFDNTVKEILLDSEKAAATAEKKAAPLVRELYAIASELENTLNENNMVMERWCCLIGTGKQPTYYNRNTSEVLYLGKIIKQRIASKSKAQGSGDKSAVYDSIPAK